MGFIRLAEKQITGFIAEYRGGYFALNRLVKHGQWHERQKRGAYNSAGPRKPKLYIKEMAGEHVAVSGGVFARLAICLCQEQV